MAAAFRGRGRGFSNGERFNNNSRGGGRINNQGKGRSNSGFSFNNHRGGGNQNSGNSCFGGNRFTGMNDFEASSSSQSNNNRGGFNQNNNSRPRCQICDGFGHTALDCYHRMDYAYQGRHPPSHLAAMAASSNQVFEDPNIWLSDSGATNHITFEMANLDLSNEYDGEDTMAIGNGQDLSITHAGHSFLQPNLMILNSTMF